MIVRAVAIVLSLLALPTIAVAQTSTTPAPKTPAAKAATEAANRKLVVDFWRNVFDARDIGRAKDYLAEDYIQHNPTVGQGLKGFLDAFGPQWKEPRAPGSYKPTDFALVMADGDLVQLVLRSQRPDPDHPGQTYEGFWFDLFRVRNGKIVEHWDAARKPVK